MSSVQSWFETSWETPQGMLQGNPHPGTILPSSPRPLTPSQWGSIERCPFCCLLHPSRQHLTVIPFSPFMVQHPFGRSPCLASTLGLLCSLPPPPFDHRAPPGKLASLRSSQHLSSPLLLPFLFLCVFLLPPLHSHHSREHTYPEDPQTSLPTMISRLQDLQLPDIGSVSPLSALLSSNRLSQTALSQPKNPLPRSKLVKLLHLLFLLSPDLIPSNITHARDIAVWFRGNCRNFGVIWTQVLVVNLGQVISVSLFIK